MSFFHHHRFLHKVHNTIPGNFLLVFQVTVFHEVATRNLLHFIFSSPKLYNYASCLRYPRWSICTSGRDTWHFQVDTSFETLRFPCRILQWSVRSRPCSSSECRCTPVVWDVVALWCQGRSWLRDYHTVRGAAATGTHHLTGLYETMTGRISTKLCLRYLHWNLQHNLGSSPCTYIPHTFSCTIDLGNTHCWLLNTEQQLSLFDK
jgi:hypothetical protein